MTEIHRYAPSATERRAATTNVVWSSIMAVLYDPLLWLGEIAGMRRRRSVLPSEAHRRVVEIGAVTGLNGARRRLQPPHPRPDPILRFHR